MEEKNKNIKLFESSVSSFAEKGVAPVHLWNPKFCGDLDIRILRNGTWYYNGSPINRKRMVKLFSNIIKREGSKYFLVSPVEKIGIVVEDVPFVTDSLDIKGHGNKQVLTFTTQVGDKVILSKENPIRFVFDKRTNEPSPYILVRNNLEALIDRKSYYRMIELGKVKRLKNKAWFGIWSSANFFPIVLNAELI